MIPHMMKLPIKKFWSDYDTEADVMYINFLKPQKATDSEMLDNGILVRFRNDKLVGLTILDASKRK
ncbi:MAG: hypothetical protein A2X61_12130 [Ignavibacteria bacterium GWB2_35_12]|nr:MAG: hypothetical protein A2X61_12130 [Ignavibacteria bacterium GWB2_35_12]OGU90064.1 MAG: hypothetical protein A2220_04730 [Ignavibacteria bacterium RIFOXYA2_FULL_35_10]OGV19120.1 MAG: hypothetical protein A2475_00925 [Ignavibacteria bacterium RIFOXYC2_FULL_35_21]